MMTHWCDVAPKSAFAFFFASLVVQLGSPDLPLQKVRGGDPNIEVILSETSEKQCLSLAMSQ